MNGSLSFLRFFGAERSGDCDTAAYRKSDKDVDYQAYERTCCTDCRKRDFAAKMPYNYKVHSVERELEDAR